MSVESTIFAKRIKCLQSVYVANDIKASRIYVYTMRDYIREFVTGINYRILKRVNELRLNVIAR